MKISKSIFTMAMILATAAGLSSCNEDLAQAPVTYPVGGSAENIGSGDWNDPMQVWQAAIGSTNGDRTTNWVTGYIIGAIRSGATNNFASAEIGDSVNPTSSNNNVILAQYPYNELEWEKIGYSLDDCIAVQLVSGGCRKEVDLYDNPTNFNRKASFRGTTGSNYMGQYGLRNVYEFNWGDIGRYEEPLMEIGGQYFCNFTASRDMSYYTDRGWNNFVERGGLSGWTIGNWSGIYYAGMSAYYGTDLGGPYINWLISPELDLDQAEYKTVSFETDAYNATSIGTLKVYVLNHKNPLSGDPQEIEAVIATTDAWTKSGTIDLSEFSGKIRIGFKFEAEKGGANVATEYRLTNFNFGNADPEEWEVVDPATLKTYRRVDAPESGKQYALVFGNVMLQPLAQSYNYGYASGKTVKITDGQFEVGGDYTWTLTQDAATGQWLLQDVYDKFYYLSGTFASFNVSQEMPAEGQWWNLNTSAGGYRLVNVSKSKTLIYSESNNHFECVASSSIGDAEGIEFYELVDVEAE